MLNDKNIDIDFFSYQERLQIQKEAAKTFIFDPIRKKKIVLTPEELLRQLLLLHLIEGYNYPKNKISVEKKVLVNGLDKRFDILVYDNGVDPFLLIECKAPKVPVNQAVFEQISSYNFALKVPYLLVSNGLVNYCCEIDYDNKSFQFIDHIPPYPNK